MDKNDFELRMERVRNAMKELIDDHKMYFGHEDEIKKEVQTHLAQNNE